MQQTAFMLTDLFSPLFTCQINLEKQDQKFPAKSSENSCFETI